MGAMTTMDFYFTSGDWRTFSNRRRGCLIYGAPNGALVVHYTKEETDDGDDGVVESPLI